MNTAALNNRLSFQTEMPVITGVRPTAENPSFADYLTAQAGEDAGVTLAQSAKPETTLYDAAGITDDTIDAGADTTVSAAASPGATLTQTSNNTDANMLMMLLLMMSGNTSGESGGMNAAMMSLLSGVQGEGLSGLTGASSLAELAAMLSGQAANPTGQAIVDYAMTRLGDPYSKSKRGTGNYVDCSYFAQWAYKQAGIEIPGTAARQAQYCHENGYEITKDQLRPGDLIFWTKHSSNAGRWRNIHHVAMYAGNGKIVEAKNPQNGVEIDDIWGREGNGGDWEIVMYARPY